MASINLSAISDKDVRRLLRCWQDHGAVLVSSGRRSAAIMVRSPHGGAFSVHTTVGDRRHLDTLRGIGRRMGLPGYPGDPHVKIPTTAPGRTA